LIGVNLDEKSAALVCQDRVGLLPVHEATTFLCVLRALLAEVE
jgi:hypothetical protein